MPGAVVLRGFAREHELTLLDNVRAIATQAPWRHLITPGGLRMSVAMTNCGQFGWVSDVTGYRYEAADPLSGQPWPSMPDAFLALARDAAATAGFADFRPDACLLNRYAPGTRLSLHQDRDERDLRAPIVSVSLGLPAVFLFGGLARAERRCACGWRMAMWWYGVARPGWRSTALRRWPTAITRWWAASGST